MSASVPSHERIEELVAADALDGLDEAGRRELAEQTTGHDRDCRECRRLVYEYSEAAAALATTLDPVPLSPGAEDRLMAAIREPSPEGLRAVHEASAPSVDRTTLRERPPRRMRWLGAMAAAAAIALVAGIIGYSAAPKATPQQTAFIGFVSHPGTRIVAFPPKGEQRLVVVFRPGEARAWVVGSHMPEPPGDRVYELWFRQPASKRMQPAGIFVPENGRVTAPVTLKGTFDTVAVSVEPPGGSDQPTSEPIFVMTV